MRIFSKTHVSLLILSLFLLGLPTNVGSAPQSQEDWAFYQAALNVVLPLGRTAGYFVGYRYTHVNVPADVEYSFVLGFNRGKDRPGLERFLTAEVVLADTIPIYKQVSELRLQNPQATSENIESKLKILSYRLSEKECPAIRSQFEKFTKLQFGSPNFNLYVLDEPTHEFLVVGSDGSMNLRLFGGQHPMAGWALETRRALQSCIPGGPGSTVPKH